MIKQFLVFKILRPTRDSVEGTDTSKACSNSCKYDKIS